MSIPRWCGAALLTLAFGAACTNVTGVDEGNYGPDAESRAAVLAFADAGTSLAHAGADPDVVRGYYNLASFVSDIGRARPITITIDGVAEEYLASVRELKIDQLQCYPDPVCSTVPPPSLRSFVAWRRSDPRRVVQVTSTTDQWPVGDADAGTTGGPFFGNATVTLFDGAGGVFAGTSGTISLRLTSKSDEPCVHYAPLPPGAVEDVALARCTRAEYSVAFTGALQPPATGGPRGNTAAGSHTIAMTAQPVSGGQLIFPLSACWECRLGGYPTYSLPPLAARARPAVATLTAVVTDVVTFTFTVTNLSAAPVSMHFGTSQLADIIVWQTGSGTPLWRWSADKAFTQVLTTRTLAPGEQLVTTGQWTTPAKGSFGAHAMLANYSAYADVQFQVP